MADTNDPLALSRAAGLIGPADQSITPPAAQAQARGAAPPPSSDGSDPLALSRAAGLMGNMNTPPDPEAVDPDTGIPLVIQQHPWAAQISTIIGSAIDAVPGVGPAIRHALDSTIATTPEAMQRLQMVEAAARQEHPWEAAAGGVIGSVAGYGALMATFPEAFGMGQMVGLSMPARAAISSLTNAVIQGTDAFSRGDDPASAAAFGAIMGGAAPPVGDILGKLFSNVAKPAVTELAQKAISKWGISLRPDAVTDNPLIRHLSNFVDLTPGAGQAGPAAADTLGQWRTAVSSTIGEDTPNITTDVMASVKKRLQNSYKDIYAQADNVISDQPFQDVYNNIRNDITGQPTLAWKKSEKTAITNLLTTVHDAFDQNAVLTPEAYQSLTKTGSYLDRLTNSPSPNIQQTALQMKNGLSDLLGRNLSPELQQQLATTDRQYSAMKTMEDLIARHPDGAFSPEEFANAALHKYGGMAYGQGGDFAELANIGQMFLKGAADPVADRSVISRILSHGVKFGELAGIYGLGHGAGYLAGVAGHPVGMAAAGLGWAAARGIGAVLRRPSVTNRLVQSAMGTSAAPSMAGRLAWQGARGAVPALAAATRPVAQNALQAVGIGSPPQSPSQ